MKRPGSAQKATHFTVIALAVALTTSAPHALGQSDANRIRAAESRLSARMRDANERNRRNDYVLEVKRNLTFRGGRITVSNRFGSVRVRTHSSSDVELRAVIRASSKELGEQLHVNAAEASDGVSVRTVYPNEIRGGSFSVDVDLVVPANASLAVENRFGDTVVEGLQGPLDINSAQGSVTLRGNRGRQEVENSFGSVMLDSAGGEVVVRNANGSATVQRVRGNTDVSNRFGSVVVSDLDRNASVRNENGSVAVRDVAGSAVIVSSFDRVTASDIRGTLDLTTTNGGADVSDIGSRTTIHSTFGHVSAKQIGSTLTITGENSRIVASGVRGPAIVRTTFGNVSLSDVAGNAKITNSNGSISASDIHGPLEVDARFGTVRAERIHGDTKIVNSSGNVTLAEIGGGASVRTSFGSVFLRSIGGTISVDNQNGAISVDDLVAGGCHDIALRTNYSSIKVGLPAASNFQVDAHTSFGSITSDIPVSANVSSADALRGTIGRGGCRLELKTANGNISIEKR